MSLTIEGFTNKDGTQNAKVIYNNKTMSLHSISPYKEAEKIAAHFNPELECCLIVGFGMGYLAEYLLENTDYQIIIFEHTKDIMDYAKNHRDIKNIIENKRVFIVYEDFDILLQTLQDNKIKDLNYYFNRAYVNLFPDIIGNIEGLLAAYLSKREINKATIRRFQKTWLKNILKNSYYYFRMPGINDIRHQFKDKPAVIIGAGPSLEKNINKLKEQQNKLLLIASDTALPMLESSDISPDFVVSIDPQDKNCHFLLYTKNRNPYLILDSSASYISIAKYNPERTILTDNIFPLYKTLSHFFPPKGELLSGGSVSTNAFDLARFFNANPIIFIGQDLAFSGRKTHNRGNILEDFLYYRINRFDTYEAYNSKMLLMADKIEIKGFHNDNVSTDRKFVTFLEWFKREIKKTSADVINATEGGAYIEGAKHMSFDELTKDILNKNDSFDKSFSTEYKETNDKDFLEFLKGLNETVLMLLPKAEKAYKASGMIEMLFEKNKNYKDQYKHLNDFDTSLLKCSKEGNAISKFIEFTMQNSIDGLLESSNEKEITTALISKWINLYKEAYFGLRYIKHLIEKRLSLSL